MRYFILLLAWSSTAWAGHFAEDFLQSFPSELFPLKTSRFEETAQKIYLARPSLLERWGVINTDAAASYNNYINTIILKEEITRIDQNGKLRLPTISELKQTQPSIWVNTVGQIFHEMGHAEYDLFVEEKSTVGDLALMKVLEGEFSDWLKANYPTMTASQITLSQWEIFGYYRGDLISNILIDWTEILHRNGIEPNTEKCVIWGSLKKLARTMPKEEFLNVLPIGSEFDVSYRDSFSVSTIYIKGEEVDLNRKNPELPKLVYKSLYDHLNEQFMLPANKRALVKALQNSSKWRNKIRSCHLEIYTQAHLISPQNLLEIENAEEWKLDREVE